MFKFTTEVEEGVYLANRGKEGKKEKEKRKSPANLLNADQNNNLRLRIPQPRLESKSKKFSFVDHSRPRGGLVSLEGCPNCCRCHMSE